MDIKIRLTRNPLTTALWTILTAAMALLLSVGAAMMYSSGSLVDILDGYHTSIALRTDRTNSEQETVLPNGALFSGIVYEDKSFDEQDAAYFESLDCVEEVYFHTMSAAYCPDFVPAISGMRLADFDEGYEYIVLVGEVTELTASVDYGAVYDPDRKDVEIYGVLHIEEILLQNGKQTRRNGESDEYMNFYLGVYKGQESFVQIGQRYVFLGTYDPLIHGYGLPDFGLEINTFHPWINQPGETELVGDTLMYVDYRDYEKRWGYGYNDAPAVYGLPAVKPITGTVEEFLADPENAAFVQALERLEKQNHSLVVMGTENLDAVYAFTTNNANITQGRSFTDEEYVSGAKVCILSETVANASGIAVGDTITLEQFLCAENNITVDDEPYDWKQNNPNIGRVNIRTEYAPAEEFTVVGLYRQRDEWGDGSYAFSPNTVFIPKSAQIAGAYGGPSREKITDTWVDENGVTQNITEQVCDGTFGIYFSMKLKNGRVGDFEDLMESDERFRGQFLTVDQGFGAVMEKLEAINASTLKLTGIAVLGWLLLLALFVLLYQGAQRKNLGIMRSLGAAPKTAADYLWKSGLTVAAVGITIGTAISLAVIQVVQSRLLENAVAELPSNYSLGGLSDDAVRVMTQESQLPIWLLLLLAAGQIALFALILRLQARNTARKNPRELLQM